MKGSLVEIPFDFRNLREEKMSQVIIFCHPKSMFKKGLRVLPVTQLRSGGHDEGKKDCANKGNGEDASNPATGEKI